MILGNIYFHPILPACHGHFKDTMGFWPFSQSPSDMTFSLLTKKILRLWVSIHLYPNLPNSKNDRQMGPKKAQITCQQMQIDPKKVQITRQRMRLPQDCQTGVVLPEVQGLAWTVWTVNSEQWCRLLHLNLSLALACLHYYSIISTIQLNRPFIIFKEEKIVQSMKLE